MVLEISLEETNRLRGSLGLRLIPVGPQPQVDTFVSSQKPEKEDVSSKIEKQREHREHRQAIAGTALGKDGNTKSWLERIKQRSILTSEIGKDSSKDPASDTGLGQDPAPNSTGNTPSGRGAWGNDILLGAGETVPRRQIMVLDTTTGRHDVDKLVQLDHATQTREETLESESKRKREDTFDPLDATTDNFAPQLLTKVYREGRPVKFRKRIKKAKSDDRKSSERDYKLANPEKILIEEEEEFEKVIERNRTELARRRVPLREEVLPIERVETESQPLVVSETLSFLESVKRMKDSAAASSKPPSSSPECIPQTVSNAAEAETAIAAQAIHLGDAKNISDRASTEWPGHPTGQGDSTDRPLDSVASVLTMLRSKGAVNDEENRPLADSDTKRYNRQWAKKITETRLERQARLEEQRQSYKSVPAKVRAEIEALQEQQAVREEAIIAEQQFADYRPVVELVHKDDEGHRLSAKEAFKHMSRHFHGNAEGKKRVQRRRQQQESGKQFSASLFP